MPDPFAHILGHDATIDHLRAAQQAGRLPHGLLFVGPQGVGKFTAAKALATQFLGGDEETAARVADGSHADLHVVTRQLVRYHDKTGKSKAIQMTIDVIRAEVVEPANRKSVTGQGKVFLVEEADTMNAAAQNALLKTLEEPQGRTLLILLTDNADGLLATIHSRTQTFRFSELSEADTLRVLEQQGVSSPDARRAVQVAGGSPGRAMKWLADGVVDRALALPSLLDRGAGLSEWLKESAEAYAAKQLERDPLGSNDAFTREGYALYLRLAADVLRDRLRQHEDADTLEGVCEKIDAVARAEGYLAANVNTSLVLRQLELSLS